MFLYHWIHGFYTSVITIYRCYYTSLVTDYIYNPNTYTLWALICCLFPFPHFPLSREMNVSFFYNFCAVPYNITHSMCAVKLNGVFRSVNFTVGSWKPWKPSSLYCAINITHSMCAVKLNDAFRSVNFTRGSWNPWNLPPYTPLLSNVGCCRSLINNTSIHCW